MNFSTTTTAVRLPLCPLLVFFVLLISHINLSGHTSPIPPVNGCDLLSNYGFETGNANGWSTTGNLRVNQQYVGEGNYGAYVEYGAVYQDIPYSASCDAYQLRVFSGIHDYDDANQIVFVKFLDANNNVLLEVSEEVTNYVEDGPLQEYDLFATPPAGTTTVRVGADSKNGRYVKLDAFCFSGTCPPPCSVSINSIVATDCAFGQYSADVTFSFNNAPGEVVINGCTFLPTGTTGAETFKLFNLPCDGTDAPVEVYFADDVGCQAQQSITPPCPKVRFCVGKR